FLHVGAKALAEIGDYVGIADLESQKGVGGVLDQLRAADRGNQEFRTGSRGAVAIVSRAGESALKNRIVDFAKERGCRVVLNADHDSVGMKEIVYGSSFAEEFGV